MLPYVKVSSIDLIKSEAGMDSLCIKMLEDEETRSHIAEEYYFSCFNNLQDAFERIHLLWAQGRSSRKSRRSIYDTSLPQKSLSLESFAVGNATGGLVGSGPGMLASRSKSRFLSPEKQGLVDGNFKTEGMDGTPRQKEGPVDSEKKSTSSWMNWVPYYSSASKRSSSAIIANDNASLSDDLSQHRPSSSEESYDIEATDTPEKITRKTSWPTWVPRPSSAGGSTDPMGESMARSNSAERPLSANSSSPSKSDEFQKIFGFPASEKLLFSYSCYLHRVLLRIGKIFISENYVCFHSRLYGIRTKAVIPIADIHHVYREKNTKVLFYGITIVTKDLITINFEFHSSDTYNRCFDSLCHTVNFVEDISGTGRIGKKTPAQILEDLKLEDIHVNGNASSYDSELESGSKIATPKPMHITCLTIGTRGIVL